MPRKRLLAGREARQPVDDGAHSDSDVDGGESVESHDHYKGAVNLPAHQTKHLAELVYRFPSIDTSFRLIQRNDTNSTGSSLWLSSQVLASYLLHTYSRAPHQTCSDAAPPMRKKVLELGSGTGLLSLLMARLGWQVTATDIPPVLDSVLRPNIEAGLYQLVHSGLAAPDQLHVCELDWTTSPDNWHPQPNTPSTPAQSAQNPDLIITADTIYEPSIVRPLLSTLAHFYHRQDDTRPTVLLALERRDPPHITEALRIASHDFSLPFKQVPAKRVRKMFDALGDGAKWSRDDWEGVEIWKL
ncbi:hypothetical protein EX895_001676 [Sporisorium graminicola]|uniref:Uncharacterized protein n=1 Tax=Sporisorium graminicola TaxID=280036 RepID=A0A4U7KWL9_9BASI|nr:hypothetical protein EX895_001676 [Sporisorium graminicola]TKY89145.1 hypothetical protein EX895_001676 [Sporisorium graminicola]